MTYPKLYFYALVAFTMLWMASCDKYKAKIAPSKQDLAFLKYYGNIYSQVAADLKQTADGGFIVFGSTTSYGDSLDLGKYNNFYVIKTDSLGNEVWSRTYGDGTSNVSSDGQSYITYNETARRILVLPDDGGYLLVGNRQRIRIRAGQPSIAESRIYFVLIDLDGERVDFNIFPDDGQDGKEYTVSDIKYDAVNTCYVLAGTTTAVNINKPTYNPTTDFQDIYVAKLTDIHTKVWGDAYGFGGNDNAASIEIGEQAYIATGTTHWTQDNTDQFIAIKHKPESGIPFNQDHFGKPGNDLHATDAVYDTSVTPEVLTILGYSTRSGSSGVGDIEITQLTIPDSRSNNSISCVTRIADNQCKCFTFTKNIQSIACSVVRLTSGYLVTSTTVQVAGINQDVHVLRLDNSLNMLWEKTFGAGGTEDKAGRGLAIEAATATGSELKAFAFTATFDVGTNKMIGLVKMNLSGDVKPQ